MKKFEEEIKLKNFLFHGLTTECLSLQEFESCLDKFERIIISKAILSRNGIINKFGQGYFDEAKEKYCTVNWNGDDFVCVCKQQTDSKGCTFPSEAFRLFCRNGFALIVDKSILEDVKLDSFGQFQDGEIRIKDKIDFCYIKGILIDRLNPTKIAGHKKNLKFYTREETRQWLESSYQDGIYQLFDMLDKYNLDLPVYSSQGGKIIKPLEEVLDEVYFDETTLSQ